MSVNVNYGEFDALMHPDIKNALRTRSHCLGNNNAYPTLLHTAGGNFEQIAAKKRFNDLIEKYKQAGELNTQAGYGGIMAMLQNITMNSFISVMRSCEIELSHHKQLEDLAVDIVRKDFNIKGNDITFDVHIVGFGEVAFPSNMTHDKESFTPPPSIAYDANDEVHKRRLINALISGASKKGHYIFHLGKEELDKIDPQLIPLYQLLMSANDLTYYIASDKMASDMSKSDEMKAGFEVITFDDDGKPTIHVEAINFPTLLHEIIKAVIELIATLALPDDRKLVEFVYDESDFLMAEMWYLRLGPIYWERLMNCFRPEHMDVKSQLLGKIFELPTNEFNMFMHSALSENMNGSAQLFIHTTAVKIKEDIRNYNQDNM